MIFSTCSPTITLTYTIVLLGEVSELVARLAVSLLQQITNGGSIRLPRTRERLPGLLKRPIFSGVQFQAARVVRLVVNQYIHRLGDSEGFGEPAQLFNHGHCQFLAFAQQ